MVRRTTTKPSGIKVGRVSSEGLHKDAWTGPNQDPKTYLTTAQLADNLTRWASNRDRGRKLAHPETIYRWCRKWFGQLPEGRKGLHMGYRIPHVYKYVARLWWCVEDAQVREVGTRAILEDSGTTPKSWVVVVADYGSTHYTGAQVADRVHSLLAVSEQRQTPIHVFYVGDKKRT